MFVNPSLLLSSSTIGSVPLDNLPPLVQVSSTTLDLSPSPSSTPFTQPTVPTSPGFPPRGPRVLLPSDDGLWTPGPFSITRRTPARLTRRSPRLSKVVGSVSNDYDPSLSLSLFYFVFGSSPLRQTNFSRSRPEGKVCPS